MPPLRGEKAARYSACRFAERREARMPAAGGTGGLVARESVHARAPARLPALLCRQWR